MAGPLRKKLFFFNLFFQRSKISTAIKLEDGRGLGLNGPAIKTRTFFSASLRMWAFYLCVLPTLLKVFRVVAPILIQYLPRKGFGSVCTVDKIYLVSQSADPNHFRGTDGIHICCALLKAATLKKSISCFVASNVFKALKLDVKCKM